MAAPVRVLIEGALAVRSPLHLGSGEATARPGLDVEEANGAKRPAEVSAVVVDVEGRAYLPGRALKGALRSWLEKDPSPGLARVLTSLFGSAEILPLERRRNGEPAFGGKAEFCNAFLVDVPAKAAKLPYWEPGRATAVRASVALDRRTRTVAGDRLFFEEFVPPGVTFHLRIAGQDLTEEEIDLLLAALDGFNQESRPFGLGAGGADGHGRFTWTPGTFRRLGPGQLAGWFAQQPHAAGYEGLPALADAERDAWIARSVRRWPRPAPAQLAARVEIEFESPFLVAAPYRKSEQVDAGDEPDRVPVTDGEGQPVLPASSLRGALRARAERILRTLGLTACRPESDGACTPIHNVRDVRTLCPACRLFGAPGWGALVEVSDFTQVETRKAYPVAQEHVAIDRFSGGVSGSLKFNERAFVGAHLAGTIALDLSRRSIEPWMAGLLGLVLRDLAQGDLPLGFGTGKGYGACRAQVTAVSGFGIAALSPAVEPDFHWSSGSAVPAPLRAALVEAVASFHALAGSTSPSTVATVALPKAASPPAPVPAPEKLSPDEFHNPYHFIPLEPEMEDPEILSRTSLSEGRLEQATHDRFLAGDTMFSGRILFQVKTETPTVVGAQHIREDKKEPALVEPYELDGEPAIPGASLRGVLSSLAEAATGSAMRVLHDRSLSHRPGWKVSLPAIGRLVKAGEELALEPLALPAFASTEEGQLLAPVPQAWQKVFPQPLFRIYINGYFGRKKEGVVLDSKSFLGRRRPESSSSQNPNEVWYYPVGSLPRWGLKGLPVGFTPHVKKTPRKAGGFSYQVVAQRKPSDLAVAAEPITKEEFDGLSEEMKRHYVPGILRVLDIEGHEKDIPAQRTHEVFLPLPPSTNLRPLRVAEALDAFHRLADERTEDEKHLPFSLKGMVRDEKGRIRLAAGDLVFFQVDSSDPTRVTELALSSIWRRSAGSVFDYVPERLRPFHPGRATVSLAERLFGFVEQGLASAPGRPAILALAGRVRVSFGRLAPGAPPPWYLVPEPVPLAILASPKPPSPALYFRHRHGAEGPISKRALAAHDHEIQGRKVYLHRRDPRWRFPGNLSHDKRRHLRSLARPLAAKLPFLARLDFDNLSERELGLLLYVLRPTDAFRHKLGMGKALGLGSVEIAPLGLFLIDRRRRYGEESDLLAAHPYHQVSLPAPLPGPVAAACPEEAAASGAPGPELADLVGRFRAAMVPKIRWTLELLGDPKAASAPVTYPRAEGQEEEAEEGFEWFARNEDHPLMQHLKPVVAHAAAEPPSRLPTLRNEATSSDSGSGNAPARADGPRNRPGLSGGQERGAATKPPTGGLGTLRDIFLAKGLVKPED